MVSPAHSAHGRVEIIPATERQLILEGTFDAGALARLQRPGPAMIPVPANMRVWLAAGGHDMCKGCDGA